MSDKKTLVVGASGQVGTQMMAVLGETALATSRVPRPESRPSWLTMDLAEIASLQQATALLQEHTLSAIYCVGGMTYVDGCEAQPDLAWRTNARGPGVLAEYARKLGVPYVYFSTDYVFDGAAAVFDGAAAVSDGAARNSDPNAAGPYDENSRTNPLSVYGRTKLEGEQRVMTANPDALVLRTTWVYGADPREKNFLYTLMRNLASGQTLRTPMRTPTDQVSTPTYNRDLIHVSLGLVEAGASGIFHVAGPDLMSRMEFAQRLATSLGLDAGLLQPATTEELGAPAARPLAAGLKTGKLRRLHPALTTRGVTAAMEDCGAELRAFLDTMHSEQ